MKRIKLENHQNISKLSINSLPTDVLLEIFQYFDESSLRFAMQVCQTWSQIIKSSPSLTRNWASNVHASIHMSITCLMYKKVHLIDQIISNLNKPKFKDLLQTYGQNIQHLILEEFIRSGNDIWEKLRNYSNTSKSEFIVGCDENLVSKFTNLTQLDLKVNSLKIMNVLKNSKFNLKIFKINLKYPKNLNDDEFRLLHDFLKIQKDSLRELTLIGLPITSQLIKESINFELLTKFEFEIDMLDVNLEEMVTSQKFRILKILEPKDEHKNFILKASKAFSGIQSLSVAYTSSELSGSIFNDIPNFKSGLFTFEGSKFGEDYFRHLQELSIKRINNESQLKKLIRFLKNCENLKSLNLNLVSNRAKLDQNLIEILTSCKSLKQLSISAYSDNLDISSSTFEALKSLDTSLKKLTIKVANRQVQEMKINARILLSTKIQTIVMEEKIRETRLDFENKINVCEIVNHSRKDGICTLKK